MGLFSFISSGVSKAVSVVSKVASGISKIISGPTNIPPIITGPNIFELVGKVIDFFRGKKYDHNTASTDETKSINRDLAEYAKTFHSEANRVEEELLENANDYFDKVIIQLEEMQAYDDFMKELPLQKIKKEIRELRKELKGDIKYRISKAYSLDNQELLTILNKESDSERVKGMEQYAKAVMKESIEEFLDKIDELSDKQLELVQDLILSQVNQIALTINSEQTLLQELKNASQQDKKELGRLKEKISSTIDLCDVVIEELKTA